MVLTFDETIELEPFFFFGTRFGTRFMVYHHLPHAASDNFYLKEGKNTQTKLSYWCNCVRVMYML